MHILIECLSESSDLNALSIDYYNVFTQAIYLPRESPLVNDQDTLCMIYLTATTIGGYFVTFEKIFPESLEVLCSILHIHSISNLP